MRKTATLLSMLSLAYAGCGDKDPVDDTQPSVDDTDPSVDDTEQDTEAELETTALTIRIRDANAGTAVQGYTATSGDDTQTSDAEGIVVFDVPRDAWYHVEATKEGYADASFVGYASAEEQSMSRSLGQRSLWGLVLAGVGLEDDPTKGSVHLVVRARDGQGNFSFLAGVTAKLTGSSEATLTSNTEAWVVGETSLEGGASDFLFVNVETGTTGVTIDAPDGYTCTAYDQGAVDELSLPIVAAGYTTVSVVCDED